MAHEIGHGRKSKLMNQPPIPMDNEDGQDDYGLPLDALDKRSRQQLQATASPAGELRDAVYEALRIASGDETGASYLASMAKNKPAMFAKLLAKTIPREQYYMNKINFGDLSFLHALSADPQMPVELRLNASAELLKDQERIKKEATVMLKAVFMQLKVAYKEVPPTTENMVDLLTRIDGWLGEEIQRAKMSPVVVHTLPE